ncbi:MAG: hypothetical protein DRQ56_09470 [Gammaproteobacteria bacterium]|nr:MAG: hypothetical protein DRQ56_09470 [Gammaproteobacteria bacterium]
MSWSLVKKVILYSLIGVPVLIAGAAALYYTKTHTMALGLAVGHGVVIGMETLFVELLAYGIVWRIRLGVVARKQTGKR